MAMILLSAVKQNLKLTCRISPIIASKCNVKYFTSNTDNIKPEGWETALPYKSIPGPKPLPLIGNLWVILPVVGIFSGGNLEQVQKKLYSGYGKIVRLGSLPEEDTVFVYSPDDIENVYRHEGVYPIRDGATKTITHYRNKVRHDVFQGVAGVLAVQGEEWHDIRSKINPILMNPRTMLQYIEGINLVTDELLAKIRHYAKSDTKKEMPADFIRTLYAWAFESVAYIALDKKLGCLDMHLDNDSEQMKLISAVVDTFKLFAILEFQPSFRNIYKTKTWKRFVENGDFLTFTFLKYIEESEARINETSEEGKSALQQLLKVDRKVAIATSLDMLGAGIDTTSKQTASILYYLAKNKNAQDTLRNELFTLLPNKDSPITKEVLVKASYLKAVIKETLRIAPIAVGNMRKSVQEMVLSGYQIPKGTNIVVCTGIASKQKENYTRPSEFLPERWLRSTTGELSHKNTSPFVTLPFGFGPRSCVGKRIANLEMEILVAKIIRNFRVEWNYKDATFGGAPFTGIEDPLKLQFNELEG